MLKIENITYGESLPTGHGIDAYQSILNNGKYVGQLTTLAKGICEPLKEIWSFTTDKPENEVKAFNYYTSEDVGCWDIECYSLEEFILAYNEIIGR